MAITLGILALVVVFVALAVRNRGIGRAGGDGGGGGGSGPATAARAPTAAAAVAVAATAVAAAAEPQDDEGPAVRRGLRPSTTRCSMKDWTPPADRRHRRERHPQAHRGLRAGHAQPTQRRDRLHPILRCDAALSPAPNAINQPDLALRAITRGNDS